MCNEKALILSTRVLQKAGNLLAKKFGAPGSRMTNTGRIDTKFLQLSSSDFSQRDYVFAWK